MDGGARRLWARARLAGLMVLALGLLAVPAGAQAKPSATEKLIKAYSPIQMLRSQENGICDEGEEQFQPMAVDVVLDNPRVQLKHYMDGAMKTVMEAPGAADIAGLDGTYYLNLPGDPLNPECTYATDFDKLRRAGKTPPITYAHIARETGHSGFVIQYWFFYYFNQFNDLHEGDWEGMQIAFEPDTAAQAMKQGPSRIAVFQHGGGEAVDWDDDEVEKEGTHPVVYPAAGSHATFFESAIFVENGQGGAGLGCDNTSDPLRRLVPRPVRIPTYPAVGTPAEWLTYDGHWGQREKGFNTGPTGPNTKTQWTEPFTWMDGLRSASPKLPGGALLGPAVTSAFCGTVAAMSNLVNLEAQSRFGLFVLLAIVAAADRDPGADHHLAPGRPGADAPAPRLRTARPRRPQALRARVAGVHPDRGDLAGGPRRGPGRRLAVRRPGRGDRGRWPGRPGRRRGADQGPDHLDRAAARVRGRRRSGDRPPQPARPRLPRAASSPPTG